MGITPFLTKRKCTVKKYIKFIGIVALIGVIGYFSDIAVIAENNYTVVVADDATATIENGVVDSGETTGWLRRTTDRVANMFNLEERIHQAEGQGEQLFEERFQQVKEQTQQLTEALQPQKKEPLPNWLDWFLLYCWYGFCSPYAFLLYMTMVLFTLYRQYAVGRYKQWVFSGSIFYCFALCLLTIVGFFITLNSWGQGNVWELVWSNDTFILLLPNSIMLLICYVQVSRVSKGKYEKSEDGFYRFVTDELIDDIGHRRVQENVDEISQVSSDLSTLNSCITYEIGEAARSYHGCLMAIILLTIGILFAPALV